MNLSRKYSWEGEGSNLMQILEDFFHQSSLEIMQKCWQMKAGKTCCMVIKMNNIVNWKLTNTKLCSKIYFQGAVLKCLFAWFTGSDQRL